MSDEGRCLRFVCFLISARKEDWFDPKENQLWIFIGRTNTETEAPKLWPPNVKSWLTGKKIPDSGKDWGQGEKGATENEMVGWRHQLNGQEIEKDREAWCATGHGVSKSQMWLSDWTKMLKHIPIYIQKHQSPWIERPILTKRSSRVDEYS